MIETDIEFTMVEMLEIKVAIEFRRDRFSRKLDELKRTDEMYEVYLRSLVTMNGILDKIYGVDKDDI